MTGTPSTKNIDPENFASEQASFSSQSEIARGRMKVWHVTSVCRLPSIEKEGLREMSYWAASEDLKNYYCETIEDEGLLPAVFEADIESLKDFDMEPDFPGIEEPISTVIRRKEEEVWALWENSEQNADASIEIVQSFRLAKCVPDISGFRLILE